MNTALSKKRSDEEHVTVTAFKHEQNGTHSFVLINSANDPQPISLSWTGSGGPEEYEMFVTSATKNCQSAGIKPANQPILLPARSVVTLQVGGSIL